MKDNQFYLFFDRRYWPLFVTQFCGCFNDNLLKSSLIMIITYQLSSAQILPLPLLILLANAIFILPYILLAGLAGQLADKYDKAFITRILKIAEIFIVCFSIYGFIKLDLVILFTSLAFMGIHSTFFGPIKYSILPEQLKKHELISANGYIEAATFIGILIGTLLGGFAVNGVYFILFLMFVVAVGGAVASFYIIKSENFSNDLEINYNIFQEGLNIVRYSSSKRNVFLSILGISWFWFIGSSFMSQIPLLTKDVFCANQYVANLFLAVFSVGVGVGSFLCNRMLSNEITTKYVFISALGISIFGIDLFFASRISEYTAGDAVLRGISSFLFYENHYLMPKLHNWRILLDLFMIAVVGGLYIVPLYASMQYFSNPNYRSRIISANNVVNAIFMIFSTLILSFLFKIGFTVKYIILIVSIANAFVAFYIYYLISENVIIPTSLVKMILKFIFNLMYKVEVRGIENIAKSGKRTVIVANHISYIDPPLLRIYLDTEFNFAVNTQIAQLWWVKPFLKIVKGYPIDPNNPIAIKSLIKEVQKDNTIAIFPEGRISNTGSLMKIYEGPGMIADKADANILPVRIEGAQYTHFSKLDNLVKKRFFPKIVITILPPVRIKPPENIDSIQKRRFLSRKLYDIMSDMMFESTDYNKTLFQSLIDVSKHYEYQHMIIQDQDNLGMTYRELLTKSFVLGKVMSKLSSGDYLGIMLPNSCAAVISFFGMQAFGKVPTMINFTSGAKSIISSCNTAKISTIFTSRKFIEKASLEDLAARLSEKINLVYLEDLRGYISIKDKLEGLISSYFPQTAYNKYCPNQDKDKEAVVLFTSGTEGQPKAVVLSHKNVQSNRYQLTSNVQFSSKDTAVNALPMFHCFGLTAGTLLTILSGIRTYFYPSPLHYRIIPEVIYDMGATIMFGTDTFLNGYAKYAHPYDFYSVRYIFAGAEKVKAETMKLWFDKFGLRIFEGYGVTEASPVISVNTPMQYQTGTVGRPLPKIQTHLLSVDGIEEGGRLCIKGPNIMMGYIKADNPGVIQPPSVEKLGDGWYDTGDIVSFDSDGYITILGRAKRFAKIAGEMVSLLAVEEIATTIDFENPSAAVHISDNLKGEQIILFTLSEKVNRENFIEKIRENSFSELLIPREFVKLDNIPVLSTGKTDYRSLISMAEEKFNKNNNE